MNNNKNTTQPIAGFDTIKMMREIREKLSEKYWKHPDILKKEMEEIRKKYHFKIGITQ
ncbi:MAG: hypothetical protein LH619_13820 [Chitinophagaceae bacterium]|nr:hypothetical protein [Chitinophagaceae bacterium]